MVCFFTDEYKHTNKEELVVLRKNMIRCCSKSLNDPAKTTITDDVILKTLRDQEVLIDVLTSYTVKLGGS